MTKFWKDSFKKCEIFEFDDHRGNGWAKKSDVIILFGKLANLSSKSSINAKYNDYGAKIFEETREGVRVYCRLRPGHRKEVASQ